MTTRSKTGILYACLAAALCLAGCYSSGVKRAERSTPTLGVMRDALSVARWEIDTTLRSLNQLARGEGDLKILYQVYMGDCESLEAELWSLRRLRSDVAVHREAFTQERLTVDPQDVQDERSREAALERLHALESQCDAVRDLFNPWFSSLQNIGRGLEHHLDPARLTSLTEQVEQANAEAGPLQAAIEELIASIDEVARTTTAFRKTSD